MPVEPDTVRHEGEEASVAADVWNTVLTVNGPECGYADGYRDGASDADLLQSAARLLGRAAQAGAEPRQQT